MKRRSVELLKDIQSSCDLVDELVDSGNIQMAHLDKTPRLAIERSFEIVGEALSRLERHDLDVSERITAKRKIIGFRNQITHGYDTIDLSAVDDIIRDFLPTLRFEVAALLAEASA